MEKFAASIAKEKFGPWAVVTGASSGIGKEFARQLAANGFNLVLVARRLELLENIGQELSEEFDVLCKAVQVDLTEENFLTKLGETTGSLDIGLIVSNAGTLSPGAFTKMSRENLFKSLQMNALSHLDLIHHFSLEFMKRRRGGILLVGAMGASNGVPYMANDAAARAYLYALGEALHVELEEHGINVTVLTPGPTNTPLLFKLFDDPSATPMKPMSTEQCVSEGLAALQNNRATCVPGLVNRIMNKIVPALMTRKLAAKMLRGK